MMASSSLGIGLLKLKNLKSRASCLFLSSISLALLATLSLLLQSSPLVLQLLKMIQMRKM